MLPRQGPHLTWKSPAASTVGSVELSECCQARACSLIWLIITLSNILIILIIILKHNNIKHLHGGVLSVARLVRAVRLDSGSEMEHSARLNLCPWGKRRVCISKCDLLLKVSVQVFLVLTKWSELSRWFYDLCHKAMNHNHRYIAFCLPQQARVWQRWRPSSALLLISARRLW